MAETIAFRVFNILSNIRKARILLNYSQQYVAFKLQISQNAYSKIELGNTTLTLRRLMEIGEIFGIDYTSFFMQVAQPADLLQLYR